VSVDYQCCHGDGGDDVHDDRDVRARESSIHGRGDGRDDAHGRVHVSNNNRDDGDDLS